MKIMTSDVDEDDLLEYFVAEHCAFIDYYYEAFEDFCYAKSNKKRRQKFLCRKSRKTCQSHSTLAKDDCINFKTKSKSEEQSFHYSEKQKSFRYIKKYRNQTISLETNE